MIEPYLYWLVRYVPDVARGEQVNVAVIAGRDGGDWAIRTAPNLRRASRLGGDAGALRPWLDSIQRSVHDYENPPLALFASGDAPIVGRAWLEMLSHRFNNILQVSAPAPVEATSAQDAVSFLYPALVATPAGTARSVTRHRIVQNLTDLYLRTGNLEVGESLFRRPRARLGRQRGRFDFAVADDHVDQLSQAFAFDVRDVDTLEQELQSWNFIVGRLRQDGGVVIANGTERTAAPDVPVSVAFQEPRYGASTRTIDVFEAAQDAWLQMGVRAVPSTQLDQIAIEARDLVRL